MTRPPVACAGQICHTAPSATRQGWRERIRAGQVAFAPLEAYACLVAAPVFKTGEAEHLGLASSIPVRLRHCRRMRSSIGAMDHAGRDRAGRPASIDPRRLVPRTDAVLADPRLQPPPEAGRRGGQAGGGRRPGTGPGRDDLALRGRRRRRRGTSPGPLATAAGDQRDRRRPAHQPGAGPAVRRRAVEALVGAAGVRRRRVRPGDRRRARAGPRRAGRARATPSPAAEAVLVVNNGAAALVLATTALAAGREVVVSRGEMVEIGDGFRLPDLIASTGPGCGRWAPPTGRRRRTTPPSLGPETGCILKVHPSNFRVEGFTAAAPVADLAGLGRAGRRRHRQRPAGPRPVAARRAGRRHRTRARAPTSSPRAATSCSAGRRRDCCSAARGGRAVAPAPAGSGPAGGQAHPRRARGHRARTGRRPTWAALRADPDQLRAARRAVAAARPSASSRWWAPDGRGRRRRRARAPAARLGGRPARGYAAALRPGPAGRRPGGATAAACSTCAACREADDVTARRGPGRALAGPAQDRLDARRRHRRPRRSRQVAPWSARSPGWSPTGSPRSGGAGMTIDLGFAWTTLPSGERLAFVDVPGHERFIAHHAGRPRPGARGAVRGRRRRGLAPPVRGAPGRRRRARSRPRAARGHPHRPRRPGGRSGRGAARIAESSLGDVPVVAVSATTGARPGRAARRAAGWSQVARAATGRPGAVLGRPLLHHPRGRHGGDRHAGRRVRSPSATSCNSGTARWSGSAACRAWARPGRRSGPWPGSRSTCATSRSTRSAAATPCSPPTPGRRPHRWT